jgi:hypothetical protein
LISPTEAISISLEELKDPDTFINNTPLTLIDDEEVTT